MSVTEEQLAELERLEREATPGPWSTCKMMPSDGHDEAVAVLDADGFRANDVCDCYGDSRVEREANARVIVAARNALPALVAEVRRLREENAMRDQRDEARELVRRYVEGDCLYEVQRLLSGVSLPAGELAAMRDQRDEEAKR